MNIRLLLFALVCAAPLPAGPELVAQNTQTIVKAPDLNVIKRSEGEGLAQGYAEAFRYISRAPLFLTYKIEGQGIVTLEGFRELKAVGAVLIITSAQGAIIAIPATHVISLASERPASVP